MFTVTQVPCLDKSEDPRKFSLNFPQETNLTIEDGAEYRLWGGEAPKSFESMKSPVTLPPGTNFTIKEGSDFQKAKLPKICKISREFPPGTIW